MASTVAMFTGLSGLNANARNLDVIGNNIANVNTTAFKTTRLLFASQFSRNFSLGTTPSDSSGGTNPTQIGLGTGILGTQRNFNVGSISATGNQTDLAIAGSGFFMVDRGNQRYYTRAGAFTRNTTNELVTPSGERVMGYGVNENFEVNTASLQPVTIPVGQLRIAQATQNAFFDGNLNASGVVATAGSNHTLAAMTDATGPVGTDVLQATSLVTNLRLAGNPVAAIGDNFQLSATSSGSSISKGGSDLPRANLPITATTTVSELLTFINQSLGINPGVTNPDGQITGASLNPTTGVISIVGHTGTANSFSIPPQSIRFVPTTGPATPINATLVNAGNGESLKVPFSVNDSLGGTIRVEMRLTLVNRDPAADGGSTWRFDIESPDDTVGGRFTNSGTVEFDGQGRLLTPGPVTASINRLGSGAEDPLTFELNFGSGPQALTAIIGNNSQPSNITMRRQDGAPLGQLASFSIGQNGLISGTFDNGLNRIIGQIPIASFANPEGLVDAGNNLFAIGANSGNPVVVSAGDFGSGTIAAGSLELANVDLSQEFINLILSSTGYSASSRVITTSDELLQQLLQIAR